MFRKADPDWAAIENKVMEGVDYINKRFDALEARIAKLEKEPRVVYNYNYPPSPQPVWAPSPIAPYWTCHTSGVKETNS